MNNTPVIKRFGDGAIRLVWPAQIDLKTHHLMMAWVETLIERYQRSIADYTLSYSEIVLYMRDDQQVNSLLDELEQLRSASITGEDHSGATIYIPVCYHEDVAVDLHAFCAEKSLDKEAFIELHTKVRYPVYFIGFLPGFPYLGGLDEKLYKARKQQPRRSVPEGAVGIAGKQTGVYPTSSPGGWNIVGQTPMRFFDPESEPPSLLEPGDRVQFYSITLEAFYTLKSEIASQSIASLRDQHQNYFKRYD